jgi:hypothetical protein
VLAVTTSLIERELAELKSRSIRVGQPLEFKRPVTLPNGRKVAAGFAIYFLATGIEATIPLFVSVQHNSDAVWVREWQQHANMARNVVGVLCVTDHPAHLVEPMAGVFGMRAICQHETHEVSFCVGSARISLMTPTLFRERFAACAGELPDGLAGIEALTIAIGDIESLAVRLSEVDIRFARTSSGAIQVGPAATLGTCLEFVAVQ